MLDATNSEPGSTVSPAIVGSSFILPALMELFEKQKKAYFKDPMPSLEKRVSQLNGLKNSISKYQTALIEALDQDFGGRSRYDSIVAEIMPSLESIAYILKRIKKWMKPSRRSVSPLFMPAKNWVMYQPLGVVGIIVPWNYPVYLSIGPLLSALAAGNRVMIKLSELTPLTNEVIKKLMNDAFPLEEVSVITGDAEVAAQFSKIPFDHLLFTGSTVIGHHVMRAAADNLTPVTLELGGKSPAIISDDFPLDVAAERILSGKIFNAGQTCVAPDYVLCPANKLDALIEALKKRAVHMLPTIKQNTKYTSIINQKHHQRLSGLISDAEAKGATVIKINPANEDFEETRKMPLHLLTNLTEEMHIMQQEIFGPLLPIMTYDCLDEAIRYVSERPRPLALYYFDFNQPMCEKVLKQTISGGVCINDTLLHVAQNDLPFGGVGHSGMGHYHGYEGFLNFSKAKPIFQKGKFNSARLIYPPFGALIDTLIKLRKLG